MKSIKKFPWQLAFFLVPLIGIVAFTNMTSSGSRFSDDAAMFASDSKHLADLIKSSSDVNKKNVYRKYKRLLDNHLAAHISAPDCQSLQAAVPSMETGVYVLFANGPSKPPSQVKCTVQNGRIVGDEIVGFRVAANDDGRSVASASLAPAQAPAASPSRLCQVAGENSAAILTCPRGQKIKKIDFASYGTPSGSCGAFQKKSCDAAKSLSAVTAACVGKINCTVTANNLTFGDPCYGVVKKLEIQATCQN